MYIYLHIHSWYVCVCVCICMYIIYGWVFGSLSMGWCWHVCVWVCVCVCMHVYTHTHAPTHVYKQTCQESVLLAYITEFMHVNTHIHSRLLTTHTISFAYTDLAGASCGCAVRRAVRWDGSTFGGKSRSCTIIMRYPARSVYVAVYEKECGPCTGQIVLSAQ